MIQDVFLSYANCPIKDKPENLREVYAEFKNTGLSVGRREDETMRETIDDFIDFAKCQNLETAHDIFDKKMNSSNNYWDHLRRKNAFEAVYYFRKYGDEYPTEDGFPCFSRCFSLLDRKATPMEVFEAQGRIRCHECYQLGFNNLLTGLAEENELSSTNKENLRHIMLSAYDAIRKQVIQDKGKTESPLGSDFKEILVFNPYQMFLESGIGANFNYTFNCHISGYSLTEFLLKNDRRKLKKCPYCQKFFVAKDIKRQRCYSDDCRKEYERLKKQKQREEDPVTYV